MAGYVSITDNIDDLVLEDVNVLRTRFRTTDIRDHGVIGGQESKQRQGIRYAFDTPNRRGLPNAIKFPWNDPAVLRASEHVRLASLQTPDGREVFTIDAAEDVASQFAGSIERGEGDASLTVRITFGPPHDTRVGRSDCIRCDRRLRVREFLKLLTDIGLIVRPPMELLVELIRLLDLR